jgi:AcrR family transcriptional regulator
MARPPDIAKKRELALRATEVLESEGLSISYEQLSRAMGINRTTLLYHFPTHADIIQTILAGMLAEQAAFVESRVAEHEHPVDRLYARMLAVHEFHEGGEARLLFLSQAVAVTGGANVRAIVKGATDLFEEGRRALVEGLERGVAAGIVAPCDAKAIVSLTRAVIDGLSFQRVTTSGSIRPMQELFWKSVLLPLKRQPTKARKEKKK